MLVTFKCRAAPDVMMLDDLARTLLDAIGKPFGPRGVIARDALPAAIGRLEAAIAADRQKRAERDGHFHDGEEGYDDTHETPPGLAQRAFVFLDMLKAARAKDDDIVWGV